MNMEKSKKRFFLAFSLMVLVTLGWGIYHIRCYKIYVNKQYVATAFSKEEAEAACRSARMQIYENNGRMLSNTVTEIEAGLFGTDISEGNELTQRIYSELIAEAEIRPEDGCRISIGDEQFVLADERSAKEVLKQVLLYYIEKAEETVEENRISCTIEQIKIHDVLMIDSVSVPENEISSTDVAFRGIIDEMNRLEYGISFDRVSVCRVSYEAEPVYQETDELFEGETKIYRNGTPGIKEVTTSERFVNGVSAQKTVWDETILEEAEAGIIYVGVKEKPEYSWPVSKTDITSDFGSRWGAIHKGIDIGVPHGTSVNAARSGVVVRAEVIGTYGKCIIIDHGDGQETRYAHLSTILVSPGDKVAKGQEIAYSGNTGRSTGPHLHFEIRIDGDPIDPIRLLSE